MEWIYHSPFNEDEHKAYLALKKELKKDHIAKRTIKLLSLMAFLRKHKFRTVEDIENSAYYDKEKTKPIFNRKTAREVLNKLKHRGGRVETNYPFFDRLLKDGISYITPDFIEEPIANIHETYLKNPTGNIKNWFPMLKILSNALHSGTSIAVNDMTSIGQGVAGPVGAVAMAPFVALATLPSMGLATAEGDIGQLAVNGLSIIPVFGDPIANGLKQGESIIRTAVDSNSSLPSYVPYIGTYVENKRAEKLENAQRLLSESVAGKRFLTQRRKYKQWKKTKRNKSAKI
jgi:hypothetical protein